MCWAKQVYVHFQCQLLRMHKPLYSIHTPDYAILTCCHRLFRAVDGTYRCKWHVPVDSLQILEPDYQNDIWDYFVDSESGTCSSVYNYGEIFYNSIVYMEKELFRNGKGCLSGNVVWPTVLRN